MSAKSKSGSSQTVTNIGSIAQDNDFIIYGMRSDYFIFTSKSQEFRSYETINDLTEQISCKFIESTEFICAMIIDEDLEIATFTYELKKANSYYNQLTKTHSASYISDFESDFALYDTIINNIKIFCFENNNIVKCNFFTTEITKNWVKEVLNVINLDDGHLEYESDYFSENSCNLTYFNSEYLFCCGAENYIRCFRINTTDFKLIKKFDLKIAGENSYLSIKNNDKFVTLFFMNQKNGNKIYEYYIYIPKCENKNFTIINSLNENRNEEERIKIKNLFEVKTNKYYFELAKTPDDIGYFILENNIIDSSIGKKAIYNDSNVLDFIVTNKKLAINKDITVNYIVSVEDEVAYESECKINLSFRTCYKSCETCFLDETKSNETHHNCKNCKDNYYPSPILNTNCFKLEEKKENWYFNKAFSAFGVCHESCKSCSGPNNDQCLSCGTNLIFYKDQCLEKCPEGTFLIKKEENRTEYFICNKCYENCYSCKEKGDHSDMKCLSCKENFIKYKNNCYKINNPNILNFVDPEDNSISSCLVKFELYIKQNTFECIPFPDQKEGYYLSNAETGLLSKCHGNCLTCENGEIEEDGKLTSMECFECKGSKKMIQVEKNCFPIIKYEDEKIVFDISEFQQGTNEGTCLYFGLSIFNGEYKCITKPENAYYVLNDSGNTGVIKYCHEACKTCNSGNYSDNTNCIECAPGYVKTEYSNTNCLLETSLPSNYYKNTIDNIYYECYQNCKRCDSLFDIFNNDMHCLECISGYFFVYGENNCYKKDELLQNKKYYFSVQDNQFHKCYYTCSECSNNEPNEEVHYCEKCADDYYFVLGKTNCYDINYIEKGYYLSNITVNGVTEPKFQKCSNQCKTCFGGLVKNSETNEINHNCKECAENYYKLSNGSFPNNCYDNETINAWKIIELSTINALDYKDLEENEMTEETSYLDESYNLEGMKEEEKALKEEDSSEIDYREDEESLKFESTVYNEDYIEQENSKDLENTNYNEDYSEIK